MRHKLKELVLCEHLCTVHLFICWKQTRKSFEVDKRRPLIDLLRGIYMIVY